MEKSYLTEIMKKVSIFSILFLCALHCWAQKEYAPLAVEGKIWEVHRYGPAPDCSIIETYMVKGDTLVGDKTYKKIYEKQEGTNWGTPIQRPYTYHGALTQENAKIFFLDTECTEAKLLYDFSLNIGDEFSKTYRNESFKMIARDTVEQYGYPYMRQHMSTEGGIPYIWTEGVGSDYGLFYTGANGEMVGSMTQLISCTWPDGRKFITTYGKEYIASRIQESYQEFVVENKTWHCDQVSVMGTEKFQYYFQGDTMVEGKTCKQLWRIKEGGNASLWGIYYEENKKVYLHSDQGFLLVYNFGLIPGEVFRWTAETHLFRTEHVEKINVGELIFLKNPDVGFVEGIGTATNPFGIHPGAMITGANNYVTAVTLYGDTVFTKDDFDKTGTPIDFSTEKGDTIQNGNCQYLIDKLNKTACLHRLLEVTTQLEIPETIQHEGMTYTVNRIADEALKGQSALETMDLPSTLTSIGRFAFRGCTKLTRMVLPNGVTKLGMGAFDGCIQLESVTMGNNVEKIEKQTFLNCTALKQVILSPTVTAIDDYAFEQCTSLAELDIPANVLSIGDFAFQGCTRLQQISFPDKMETLGNEVFRGCTALKQVNMGKNMNFAGRYCFDNCESLKAVTLGTSTRLGFYAFHNCTALEEVTVTGDLNYQGAFSNCQKLQKVIITDDVRHLGRQSFYYCDNLASITLGANVETIESGSFTNCNLMTEFRTKAQQPPKVTSNIFSSILKDTNPKPCTLYVPSEESKKLYEEADEWKKFTHIVVDETLNSIAHIKRTAPDAGYYYNLQGQKLNAPQKGINILQMQDGTTRKVLVK